MILRTAAMALTLSALMIGFGPGYSQIVANNAHCETWAADYRYPRDSYRMRQLGCNDNDVPGVYEATPGNCNRIARQAARAGLRGHDVAVYVHAKHTPCYWDADARNYAIASTTV